MGLLLTRNEETIILKPTFLRVTEDGAEFTESVVEHGIRDFD